MSKVFRNAVFAAAAMLCFRSVAAVAQSPAIELQNGAFRVNGWMAPRSEPAGGWGTVFLVYAGAGRVTKCPAAARRLFGGIGHAGLSSALSRHRGRPLSRRFPHSFRGDDYQRFRWPPRATNPVARVEQVYPTADVLPSNLLRLYIVFSAPMSRGEAAAHIHVEDDKGKVLPDELLPGQELWDPSFRRLTMTFDPGRIKRGLTSNRTIGPPITEGRHYKLVVDRNWPDARGVPMVQGFTKSFTGGPPDADSARSGAVARDRSAGRKKGCAGCRLSWPHELFTADEDDPGHPRAGAGGRQHRARSP